MVALDHGIQRCRMPVAAAMNAPAERACLPHPRYLLPKIRAVLPQFPDRRPEELHAALNAVQAGGLIRVEADEVGGWAGGRGGCMWVGAGRQAQGGFDVVHS